MRPTAAAALETMSSTRKTPDSAGAVAAVQNAKLQRFKHQCWTLRINFLKYFQELQKHIMCVCLSVAADVVGNVIGAIKCLWVYCKI